MKIHAVLLALALPLVGLGQEDKGKGQALCPL